VSWVAYAPGEAAETGVILHLSRLASHTGNLERCPRASLGISRSEAGVADPQRLARLTLSGTVSAIARGSDDYEMASSLYQTRLPASRRLFQFADFRLFRFSATGGRFVAGFASAYTFSLGEISRAYAR